MKSYSSICPYIYMILILKTKNVRVVIHLLVPPSTKITLVPYFAPFIMYAQSISEVADCNTVTWICTTELNSEPI